MIVPGKDIVTRNILQSLRSIPHQVQPCGLDLTLRKLSHYTSPATLDFTNKHRRASTTNPIPFTKQDPITLPQGTYLVDFNETVAMPNDCMGTLYPRSSLWRNGCTVVSGVVDAGYEGALGAMLEVKNPCGIVLYRDAKIAQLVVMRMEREVEGYKGVYQGARSSVGIDGTPKD